MAHYAFLDENNIVTEVIKGIDETELIEGIDPETWYGNFRSQVCKRTSINTIWGIHLLDKEPFRKNYAGIGMIYDSTRDAFYAPQPYASWTLDENTCKWEPPVAKPDDGFYYNWSEQDFAWIKIEPT